MSWIIESEQPARVAAADGVLDIDTPAGLTLWFRSELRGPVLIEYEASAVSEGGPNDRVSDLNCFWMATDPAAPAGPPGRRTGAFSDYNTLRTYYVGLGGNGNTTTRFRRYIGSETERPLLPANDRSSPDLLLQPNRLQSIRLVANGPVIQYYRDDRRIFDYRDAQPYTHGWFAIRTTKSHLRIRHFRVYRLQSVALIDLNAMSKTFYEALGPDRAALAFADGGRDRTHHSSYGAYELARMIVSGIRAADPKLIGDLARHLSPDAGDFDPQHPDPPEGFELTTLERQRQGRS